MDHDATLTGPILTRPSTASHCIAMSFSTGTTAVEQIDKGTEPSDLPKNDSRLPQLVNTDSTLPTHVLPPRDHTELSTSGIRSFHNQTIASNTNNTVTTHDQTNTWFNYVKEYAPVVGVVGTIIGVVVAIITVVK